MKSMLEPDESICREYQLASWNNTHVGDCIYRTRRVSRKYKKKKKEQTVKMTVEATCQ